jgi:hypothetical protein
MNRLDLKFLIQDSRAQVYLIWAAIVAVGYTSTHYYQNPNINFVWTALSAGGLYFMYKVMPLRVKQMRNIFLAWFVPILAGIFFSVISARGYALVELVGYLGVFWLVVSMVAFIWNGLVDRPATWYFIGAAMCAVAAAACYSNDILLVNQYLIAGIVSTWAMLNLFIFRTD